MIPKIKPYRDAKYLVFIRSKPCWICGRATVVQGLRFHQKGCAALFLKREALKPPKQRRTLPDGPKLPDDFDLNSIDEQSAKVLQDYGAKCMKMYMDLLMPKCIKCRRSFADDYGKHESTTITTNAPPLPTTIM